MVTTPSAAAAACTWGSPWSVPASFLLFMLASLAHEAVHAVGMWPIAEEIRIKASDIYLGDVHVEADIRDEEWRHKWADTVGVLPLVLGLFIAAVAITTDSLRFDRFIDLGVAFAWFIFTFAGGASDFNRQASMAAEVMDVDEAVPDGGRSWVPAPLRAGGDHPKLKRMAIWSFIFLCIGVGYGIGCAHPWDDLGLGMVLGSLVLFGRVVVAAEKRGLVDSS